MKLKPELMEGLKMKNKIHFGDNLNVLRGMDNETVALICTDPPFNFGRNYNLYVNKSSADDSWMWDKAAEDTRAEIEIRAAKCPIYKVLYDCLRGFDLVLGNSDSALRTYLTFMGPRLVEMHRILSKTGSVYLHCNSSASQYLKCLMDTIFGEENFKNEIVWHYDRSAPSLKQFHRMHDVILFYTKSNNYVFTKTLPVYENDMIIRDSVTGFMDEKKVGTNGVKRKYRRRDDAMTRDVWDDIGPFSLISIERLGYPTQKPRRLYERMIKASSNEGDVVLDPFCGGGTTLDAAQAHKRSWIGIDMSILTLDPIKHRLKDRYGFEPSKDYEIDGYPSNMQDLRKLRQDKTRHDEIVQWLVTRLGLVPAKDADSILWTPSDKEKSDVRIHAEFKPGRPTLKQVDAFRKSIEANKANIGIFITFDPVTTEMREIAECIEKFEYKGLTYPRFQFVQFTDAYFENPDMIYNEIEYPGVWHFRAKKKIDRKLRDIRLDTDIDFERKQ